MGTRHEARTVTTSRDTQDTRRTLEAPKERAFECDACGKRVTGEPAGHGLFVWTRGNEVRYEEPPLCDECAKVIGLAALAQWELEEDGD